MLEKQCIENIAFTCTCKSSLFYGHEPVIRFAQEVDAWKFTIRVISTFPLFNLGNSLLCWNVPSQLLYPYVLFAKVLHCQYDIWKLSILTILSTGYIHIPKNILQFLTVIKFFLAHMFGTLFLVLLCCFFIFVDRYDIICNCYLIDNTFFCHITMFNLLCCLRLLQLRLFIQISVAHCRNMILNVLFCFKNQYTHVSKHRWILLTDYICSWSSFILTSSKISTIFYDRY